MIQMSANHVTPLKRVNIHQITNNSITTTSPEHSVQPQHQIASNPQLTRSCESVGSIRLQHLKLQ